MIAAIVLAAGKSTRFPGNKLLERIDEDPLIRRVTRSAVSSSVDKVIVVTGYEAQKVANALRGLECEFILNDKYEEGMSSSVRAGLSAVKSQADAVLILPADVALLTPEIMDAVLEEYRRSAARIVVASHHGRGGHPILFSKELFGEIMAIEEKTYGLKAVVSSHRSEVVKVETGPQALIDIDTKEDFQRYFNLAGSRETQK